MDVDEIRLNNARHLAEDAGGISRFAVLIQKSQSQVSQIIGKNPSKRIGRGIAREIEAACEKPHGWLDHLHEVGEHAEGYQNTSLAEFRGDVPLISWVQAGAWEEVEDPYAVGDYERLVPVTKRFSKHGFALRIQGDSMYAPDGDGPSFPTGSIIAVEPQQEPRNGSFVVVRLEDTKEATFKQLVIDGGRMFLRPLNPRYPVMEIESEAQIVGVVRQLVMEFE